MKITKIIAGIDISMADFHVCIKYLYDTGESKIKGSRSFKNTLNGFRDFKNWYSLRKSEESKMFFVMEATGVYYEDLAYFLYKEKELISVVLANKIKNFGKSLNIKTKTDKIDSKIIAQFGIERNLELWEPMSPKYREIRDLVREKLSLQNELIRAKNQYHAMIHSSEKSDRVLKIKKEQIDFYEQSIKELEQEIQNQINLDTELKRKIDIVTTIPGVSIMLAVALACETNGFKLVKNIRQLVSYAGLDVEQRQSGNYNGKTRITKKGNARIRQVLYMPSLCAIQYNKEIKDLHIRVCERNPTVRNKGVVAGMRKLLILTYVLWKKEEEYQENYQWS